MAQQTINGPATGSHMPMNTGDSTELGDDWAVVAAKLNAMFNDVYGAESQQGVTTINFGAYPGGYDATATVTGQTGIVAGSNLDAWIEATATADHSIDEHWVDPPLIVAGNIVPGVGFTIYGTARDGGLDYGLYTVHWMWR